VRLVGPAVSLARLDGCQADPLQERWGNRPADRLDSRLRLAWLTSMPTNPTTPAALSRRLMNLALDAEELAYALTAHPLNDFEAEVEFGAPAFLFASVLDVLEDAIYRACKPDQSHQADDCALARLLAGIAYQEPVSASG
jgi:hypothetical protein